MHQPRWGNLERVLGHLLISLPLVNWPKHATIFQQTSQARKGEIIMRLCCHGHPVNVHVKSTSCTIQRRNRTYNLFPERVSQRAQSVEDSTKEVSRLQGESVPPGEKSIDHQSERKDVP